MLSVRSRSPAFAGVAQLAEQLICNHQVAGSIPAASTFYFERKEMLDFIATIISVGIGLFLGTMLVDWYRKNSQ